MAKKEIVKFTTILATLMKTVNGIHLILRPSVIKKIKIKIMIATDWFIDGFHAINLGFIF